MCMIRILMDAGTDFTVKNVDGLTPLMATAFTRDGQPCLVKFQLNYNRLGPQISKEEKIAALEMMGVTFITLNS